MCHAVSDSTLLQGDVSTPAVPLTVLFIITMLTGNVVVDGGSLTTTVAVVGVRRRRQHTLRLAGNADQMVRPSGPCTVLPIVLRPMGNSVVDGCSLITTVAVVAARRLRHHTLCRAGNADRSVLPSGLCTDLHIRTIMMSMRNSVVHIFMTTVVTAWETASPP